MNIIDIFVILFVLLCAFYGMHRGLIKSIVSLVGLILVFIVAYLLKDPIAEWLSLNLPFFSFAGSFKGATILNVIIYQLIAFFVIFAILMTIYSILVKMSGIVDRFIKMTVILYLPEKIGGFILGAIQGIIISLIVIIILSLPTLNFDLIRESTIRKYLYNDSPIIGNFTSNTNDAINEIIELKDKFKNDEDKEEFNLECMDALLKHKVVKTEYMEKLVYSEKLKVDKDRALSIINKYKE